LAWSTKYLAEKGSPTARLDAELLLAHALGESRVKLYMNYEKPLNDREREACRDVIRRRANQEPVAYITGTKEFFGLTFQVTPAVLIPRPDTECLVEEALRILKVFPSSDNLTMLDIGTGSGCIPIAVGKHVPSLKIEAWDLSPEALAVAKSNGDRLLPGRVNWCQRDALADSSWEQVEYFDLIISNPPYIQSGVIETLGESVRKFEPRLALDGGRDGLKFYRHLAKYAPKRLSPEGRIILEIGYDQGEAVKVLFEKLGWRDIKVTKDFDRHDRVVSALSPIPSHS